MSIGRPLALLLLPALGVLVWLYLRQPRGRVFVVPSLLLWQQVQEDVLHARRWRPDLSFLLRLVVLSAVIFGLAVPRLRGEVESQRRRIVVLDVSAGMQATTAGITRFERAVAAIRQSLHPGATESVVVVTSARRAERVLPATRDPSRLHACLDQLQASDLPGGPAAGIALARQIAAVSSLPTTIEAFTDRPGALQVASQVEDASVEIFGDERRNVGIVGLHVEQGRFQSATEAVAAVEVRNFGAEREHRSLTIELAGQPIAREGFSLEPGAARRVEVAGFATAGALVARLEPIDALAVDDRASAWVATRPAARLALAGLPPRLRSELERLAQALGVRIDDPSLPAARAAPDLWLQYGDAVAPSKSGNLLAILPDVDVAGVAVGGWLDDVAVVDWNERHPAMRGLVPSFDSEFARVRQLLPGAGAEVLLWGEAGNHAVPLVVAFEAAPGLATGERRRTVVLAFDLATSALLSNDDPALALLTTALLAWLLPAGEVQATVPVGSVVETAAGTTHVILPSGASSPLPLDARAFELTRAGLYRFVAPDGERVVTAQLADASDSDLAGTTVTEAAPIAVAGTPVQRRGGEAIWSRWAYLLATGLLCIDWLWALRRREGTA